MRSSTVSIDVQAVKGKVLKPQGSCTESCTQTDYTTNALKVVMLQFAK